MQQPWGALALAQSEGNPVYPAGVATQIIPLAEQAAGGAESVWTSRWCLPFLGMRWADLPPAELTRMTSLTKCQSQHLFL